VLGYYLVYGGLLTFFLVLAYEYGWPPVVLFAGYLHTDRSRRIAVVIGWVLTVVFLGMIGLRLWKDVPDLYRGM